MPDLAPWHAPLFAGEFREEDVGKGFREYIAGEEQLFRALEEGVRQRGPSGGAAELSR